LWNRHGRGVQEIADCAHLGRPTVAVNFDNFIGRFEMTGHRLDLQKKDTGLAVSSMASRLSSPTLNRRTDSSSDHNSISEMTSSKTAPVVQYS